MAIGVPKPETPSSRAPKQKPITTSTTRRSFGKWSVIQSRNASKRPELTAMLYSSSALTTIHMTGHRAKTTPAAAASNARPSGIRHTATAMTSPTSSPANEAFQAVSRTTPRQTRTVTTGSAATRKDSGKLPATGVKG